MGSGLAPSFWLMRGWDVEENEIATLFVASLGFRMVDPVELH